MTTIDGAASYLGMEQRKDLAVDFRSATMRLNPGMVQQLPSKVQSEIETRGDFVAMTEQICRLNEAIRDASNAELRQGLIKQRQKIYGKRQKAVRAELRKYQEGQPLVYDNFNDRGDWTREQFCRIEHMIPERRRLAKSLLMTVPLRSQEGRSALQDLVSLRQNDCSVAYQDVLRPVDGRCKGCHQEMSK